MRQDEYKVELAKYKARVADLEAAEVELVLESHQDEQRRGEWLKWYDAALAKSPPDERELKLTWPPSSNLETGLSFERRRLSVFETTLTI